MEQYLATIVPMMILSLKSTEGIVVSCCTVHYWIFFKTFQIVQQIFFLSCQANYDSNNDPSFLIEDDLDDDEDETKNEDDENDDDEDIAG